MADPVVDNGNRNFIMDLIKSVGVPTAILFYILMTINPRLDRIIDQQGQLMNVLLQREVNKQAKP